MQGWNQKGDEAPAVWSLKLQNETSLSRKSPGPEGKETPILKTEAEKMKP